MGNRDLKYRILGDNLLGRSVGGAISALGKLSKAGMHAASSMVRGMGTILKRGLQVGFAGTIAGAIWSVKDSMAVGEMESKFDAVFKAMSGSAREWSKDFASSTKRSEYDVRGWMSSIQDTLVPMGVARGEAAKLSREITALGVDIGSFQDMDSGEAIERIIGALVGNHENVRKFGVVITEASMKAEAAAMGFGKANKPLSEQEKLLVRLKMIQKGTTDAQGDAVRTSGSLANRWKGLVSIFKSFRVEVGNQIVEGLGLASVFGAMERGLGGFIAKMKESGIVQEMGGKGQGAADRHQRGRQGAGHAWQARRCDEGDWQCYLGGVQGWCRCGRWCPAEGHADSGARPRRGGEDGYKRQSINDPLHNGGTWRRA